MESRGVRWMPRLILSVYIWFICSTEQVIYRTIKVIGDASKRKGRYPLFICNLAYRVDV